ncbi:MAG: HlyD family efflux transporter periplasmic adaptor subunit [Novosphingobium sp.]|nr:HlyD family efflux transporter periplasmic adaptor subunit [Novosphingobium sp.]
METPPSATAEPGADRADDTTRTARRKRAFLIFGVVLAIAVLGFGGWKVAVGDRYVSTDNAYVGADVGQVTALIGAPVAQVLVSDTQQVKAGQALVRLDDSDARLALAVAEADLARAERMVRQTRATGDALSAQVDAGRAGAAAGEARLARARADLARVQADLARREALVASGAVSGEEMTAARNAHASARAMVEAATAELAQLRAGQSSARGSLAANLALTGGATTEALPDVLSARARLDQARLDLARTVIRAPFDGIVSGRQVEIGQRVAPGAVLMRVVPLARVYVDANFKEGQLRHVRPGQPVELVSDLYGDDVVYHGRVVGFAGGTGAAFALVPAQNATGNWIKVVQRLPVRVALDPAELERHPLRVGLSMEASIDTRAGQ